MSEFRISVQDNLPDLVRNLDLLPRQVEVATQRALLKTAHNVREDERAEMRRVFDNPTPWTLNALTVRPERNLGGVFVEVKDGYWFRAERYLELQTTGGMDRRLKGFERALQAVGVLPRGWKAVPGQAAKLDAFGNHAVGEIRQILSWFNAAEMVAGSTQNMTAATRERRRRGTKKRRGFEYFVAHPGSRVGRGAWRDGRAQNLDPGIYRKTHFGFGSSIQPVVFFVKRTGYDPRFDFFGVAQRTVARAFPGHMRAALSQALSGRR